MFICDKDEHCIDCPKNYPEETCEHWIEVVPIVRCWQCESYDKDLERCTHPQWAATEYGVWEQDFCSYGERKGGGE